MNAVVTNEDCLNSSGCTKSTATNSSKQTEREATPHVSAEAVRALVAHKVTKGSFRWLTIRTFTSTKDCVDELQKLGYKIWSTDLSPVAIPLNDETGKQILTPLPKKLAVVVGRESDGVTDEMLAASDRRVYLPMHGFTESFNLSVATALVLSVLFRWCPEARGDLPEREKARLRHRWYTDLLRNPTAKRNYGHWIPPMPSPPPPPSPPLSPGRPSVVTGTDPESISENGAVGSTEHGPASAVVAEAAEKIEAPSPVEDEAGGGTNTTTTEFPPRLATETDGKGSSAAGGPAGAGSDAGATSSTCILQGQNTTTETIEPLCDLRRWVGGNLDGAPLPEKYGGGGSSNNHLPSEENGGRQQYLPQFGELSMRARWIPKKVKRKEKEALRLAEQQKVKGLESEGESAGPDTT